MSIFNVLSLLGGLAMFLYGMRLMGDSLRENSSGTLKLAIEKVTNNPVKAFAMGLLVTALIQSSTATIVITSGLVAAGILSLHQSLGIIVGANVGTTVTGQIIRLLDLDAGSGGMSFLRFLQPSTLAPIALILGMVLIMGGRMKNAKSIGNIAIGFGILFSGLLNMTSAVSTLTESGIIDKLFSGLGANPVLGYLTGAGVAFVLQSSSATIGILQAFSSAGLLTFKAVYAVIVGVYLGDCVTTAIVCSIGAGAEQKRVGIVNIIYNLCKSALVLIVVTVIHKMGLLDALWDKTVNSGIIANTNTIFNLACAAVLLPFLGIFERLSKNIIREAPVKRGKYADKLDELNPVFFATPALSLKSCYDVLLAMFEASRSNMEKALGMIGAFEEDVFSEIEKEEEEVDHMTDEISRYLVELLPHLQSEYHVSILNQYYKVTGEFEHLGDFAIDIAELAEELSKGNTSFSSAAMYEIGVLRQLLDEILDLTDKAFRFRDVEAATQIEPRVKVVDELVSQLKKNHLKRMGGGQCSPIADAGYSNLMAACSRIAGVCSNVGIATVVRVHPELADHEHLYLETIQNSGDETFNETFEKAHTYYFGMLEGKERQSEANGSGKGRGGLLPI